MQGFIFFFSERNKFINFANVIPPAVLKINATAPSPNITKVSEVRNLDPSIVAPTATPKKIVTISIIAPPAVFFNLSVTPLSLIKFPNISIPIKGALDGTANEAIAPVSIGNIITAFLETGLASSISIFLSFLLVSSLKIGGCIIGTSAI